MPGLHAVAPGADNTLDAIDGRPTLASSPDPLRGWAYLRRPYPRGGQPALVSELRRERDDRSGLRRGWLVVCVQRLRSAVGRALAESTAALIATGGQPSHSER